MSAVYEWPEPPGGPICGAENGHCEHTRGAAYRQALVLHKMLDLVYQRGQSLTIAMQGGHGGPTTEVYLGGNRVAIGDQWQEQIMALPLTPEEGTG